MTAIRKMLQRNRDFLFPVIALFFGLLILVFSMPRNRQVCDSELTAQSFTGQYSYDGESWLPLENPHVLSAMEEDLYLRGSFQRTIPGDSTLYYYSNHIGGELYVEGELFWIDFLIELGNYGIPLQPSMCGKVWNALYFPDDLPAGTPIDIHLKNPHSFGNLNAYSDFLSTLYFASDDSQIEGLNRYGRGYTVAGFLLLIAGIFLLGAALTSAILRVPKGSTVIKFGLLCAFAGGYFLLDSMDLSFWSQSNVLNTYGWQICMMYTVYLMGVLAKDSMKGRARKVAGFAMGLSAICNALIVLSSFAGLVLIFDTLLYWVILQLVICPVMIVCSALELLENKKRSRTKLLFLMLLFVCVLLDIFGIADSLYSTGNLTKVTFLVFFICYFIKSARNIIMDHKASSRAKKLEEELAESRISIMLSQIQPHFLFNVLGTLRGLCREDPELAWRGIGDFSTYLRGNMNALTNTRFIPFGTELRHVETYLRLEQMRLGDKLRVVYDIQDKDFMIPPLTLQPLVENAVKHGIFHKAEGGTVVIHSRRKGQHVILSVQDDGIGFDVNNPNPQFERKDHIGLNNVQNRVENMLGGTFRIDSKPGNGTTIIMKFPLTEDTRKGV